jgi:hypothetical protein
MQKWRQYRSLKKGEIICVGGDCSAGCGDWSVSQFYSSTYFDYPLVWSSPEMSTVMTNEIFPVLEMIGKITGYKPLVGYERNNGGFFEMERLASMNRLGKYEIFKMPTYGQQESEQTSKLGWDTNLATRPEMLSTLKASIDNRIDSIYDKQTISELYSFIIVKTSSSVKAQAEKNSHDDHVMASAVAKMISRYVNIDKLILNEKKEVIIQPDFQSKDRWSRFGRGR